MNSLGWSNVELGRMPFNLNGADKTRNNASTEVTSPVNPLKLRTLETEWNLP